MMNKLVCNIQQFAQRYALIRLLKSMLLVNLVPRVDGVDTEKRSEFCFGTDPNCTGICRCYVGSGEEKASCDRATGLCTSPVKDSSGTFMLCMPGYRSLNPTHTDCQAKCEEGTFGINCQFQCHCFSGQVCSHIRGICKIAGTDKDGDCHPDWDGDSCQTRLPKLSNPPTVKCTKCNIFNVLWFAFKEGNDIGHNSCSMNSTMPPQMVIGKYQVIAREINSMKNVLIYTKIIGNPNDQERFSEDITVTDILEKGKSYHFRVDTWALTSHGIYRSKAAKGPETSFATQNGCNDGREVANNSTKTKKDKSAWNFDDTDLIILLWVIFSLLVAVVCVIGGYCGFPRFRKMLCF